MKDISVILLAIVYLFPTVLLGFYLYYYVFGVESFNQRDYLTLIIVSWVFHFMITYLTIIIYDFKEKINLITNK